MSRVAGFKVANEGEFACGRTVFTGSLVGNSDAQTGVVDFLIPSRSDRQVTWIVQLDLITSEIGCKCKDQQCRYDTWDAIPIHGRYLENLSLYKTGVRLSPLVTRRPSALCFHCRLVRTWLRRHGIFKTMETAEAGLEHRLENMECQLIAV